MNEQHRGGTPTETLWLNISRRGDHWIWTGPVSSTRRGGNSIRPMFQQGGVRHSPRRMTWAEWTGEESRSKLRVTCGEPACVFPMHLKENSREDFRKHMQLSDPAKPVWLRNSKRWRTTVKRNSVIVFTRSWPAEEYDRAVRETEEFLKTLEES